MASFDFKKSQKLKCTYSDSNLRPYKKQVYHPHEQLTRLQVLKHCKYPVSVLFKTLLVIPPSSRKQIRFSIILKIPKSFLIYWMGQGNQRVVEVLASLTLVAEAKSASQFKEIYSSISANLLDKQPFYEEVDYNNANNMYFLMIIYQGRGMVEGIGGYVGDWVGDDIWRGGGARAC